MSNAASPLLDRMIFLVGARRSGTFWLQRVFGAHPKVALVPSETYLFSRGISPLRKRLHHGVLGSPGTGYVYMDRVAAVEALRELCDRVFVPFLAAVPGADRLAERTPEHVMCLDVIGEVYPDAWVVNIVRDGRDVARSLRAQHWKSAPQTIEEAALEWRSSIEAAEAASPGLARFRTIRYEEMLAEPRLHIAELFGWVGLAATPEIVEEVLHEAQIAVNQDSTATPVGVGKWREELSEQDLNAFWGVAGETLERLGYAESRSNAIARSRSTSSAPGQGPERPIRRLRDRLRRGGSARNSRSGVSHITDTQRAFDRVVAAVVGRRVNELSESLLPSVWVRVVAPEGDWKGRGGAAWERLAAETRNDPALDGRQVAGDLHPGIPTSTAVLTFLAGDGSVHVRILAVTLEEGRVARLTYYRFPVAGDADR